jgi:O-succinylbenzoic acid--CoA ligase
VPAQASDWMKLAPGDPFQMIQYLLLGGGPINEQLNESLVKTKSSCLFYHTYGMTETASHVALKKISQAPSNYIALEGFQFSQDARGCLVIQHLKNETFQLITNDIVELHSPYSFEWIGRVDWVVNSGGIKYSLERAEDCVASFLHENHIANAFTSYKCQDSKWGEKWVLILEGTLPSSIVTNIQTYCQSKLGRYIYPKEILFSKKIIYLSNGKVDRLASYKEATKL